MLTAETENPQQRTDTVDIFTAWLSGGVNRWHQHGSPALRNSHDTNWAHAGRVAQLVTLLGGSASDVTIALFHDAGEKITGDKRDGIKIAADYEAEAEAAKSLGLHYPKTPLVHLCDKLDAYLWARLHGSGNSAAWQRSLSKIRNSARELGIFDKVERIIAAQAAT